MRNNVFCLIFPCKALWAIKGKILIFLLNIPDIKVSPGSCAHFPGLRMLLRPLETFLAIHFLNRKIMIFAAFLLFFGYSIHSYCLTGYTDSTFTFQNVEILKEHHQTIRKVLRSFCHTTLSFRANRGWKFLLKNAKNSCFLAFLAIDTINSLRQVQNIFLGIFHMFSRLELWRYGGY